jgi:outer membrane protein insertion porin family
VNPNVPLFTDVTPLEGLMTAWLPGLAEIDTVLPEMLFCWESFREIDWGIALTVGGGYFFNLGHQESVIDRFYLGGDNLRGFQDGGVGPHDTTTGDSLGGRVLWTESQQLNFPLPFVPRDLGLSGHLFVDTGALTQGTFESGQCPNSPLGDDKCPPVTNSGVPRVGAGVGLTWRSGFGLINIDVAPFVVKQPFDQTQLFRFGFGTRF